MGFWRRNKGSGNPPSQPRPQAESTPSSASNVGNLLWEVKKPRYAHEAKVAEDLRMYADADAAYQALAEAFKRTRGEEDPDFATATYQIARLNTEHDFEHAPDTQIIYNSLGRGFLIMAMHNSALSIRQKVRGETHRDYAESLYGKGVFYGYGTNKPDEAAEMLHRALAIQRATLGNANLEVALTLNELGKLDHAMGKPRAALGFLQEALEVHRASAAKQPLFDEATELCRKAAEWDAPEKSDDATAALARALEIQHTHMSDAYFDMVYRLYASDPRLAMMLDFHRALFLKERRLTLVATLNGLAEAHKALGDAGAAVPYLQEAVEVQRKLNDRS